LRIAILGQPTGSFFEKERTTPHWLVPSACEFFLWKREKHTSLVVTIIIMCSCSLSLLVWLFLETQDVHSLFITTW
jgi:hypothetical protein